MLDESETIDQLPYTGPEPVRGHPDDAGLDLTTTEAFTIAPGETITVNLGTAVELPEGTVGYLHARSSLHRKFGGLRLANSVGVIDAGYRGQIMADFHLPVNYADMLGVANGYLPGRRVQVPKGTRVAQMVVHQVVMLQPVEVVALAPTERGTGGHGSTDRT